MTRFDEAVPIESVRVRCYRIPTDRPESDGTLEWDSTPLCAVHVEAGAQRGFGYGFIHAAAAALIEDVLAPAVHGRDAMDVAAAWESMRRQSRNIGVPGLVTSAIGVVDIALWDLKGRLLDVNVSALLGLRRPEVLVYGSGGFTSYSVTELQDQLAGWVEEGIDRVKMKVGRETARDRARVAAAREAIGEEAELFVDANGAWEAQEAVALAHRLDEARVSWLEEPVPSDDLVALRWIRDRVPPGMRVAAGEYGWNGYYFRRMCDEAAADVIMPDAVRCGGYTGFLRAAEICNAFSIPISAHTAPQVDIHVCCAAPGVLHLEWFHDHVRIDEMLIDGARHPEDGILRPDRSRPGIGLALKEREAERYRVH